ncbi:MAG TPA: sugar transferase [Solirubrobacterales bacterium]|nr:sugar transferase [Solirubrobacterales bacterium]
MVKRAMDMVVSATALILLTPLLLAVAVAVKLECRDAPILFRQSRSGRQGRRFQLAKFRTMVPHADELKESLRERSSVSWPDFRLEHDPRVTRLGRLLRQTSIDELPQLWSVFRGEMSLVGPRPTSFAADTYLPWQTERLDFAPGLTGPWQVMGRNSMDFTERCRLEISFFRHTSMWRELGILIRTVPVLIRRTGVA